MEEEEADRARNEVLDSIERVDLFERSRLGPGIFVGLFVGSILALLYTVFTFIPDLILGMVLAGLFAPLHDRMTRGLGGRPWVASAVTTLLAAALIAVPAVFLVLTLASEVTAAYESAHALVMMRPDQVPLEWVRQTLERTGLPIDPVQVMGYLTTARDRVLGTAVTEANHILGNLAMVLLHAATVLVVLFYLLVDGERLRVFVLKLSPMPDEEEALIVRQFRRVSTAVLLGNGLASLLQGFLGGVAMAFAGLSAPVLWGTVMALLAFLPLVGITVVVVPASVYLWLTDRPDTAIIFFIFCSVQGLIVENVVKTRLMGRGARMHDLLVFLTVLGGLSAFGVMGLLYGPLIGAFFITLTELYFTRYRRHFATEYAQKRARADRPP